MDYNSRVTKGQIIARIDPRLFKTEVESAQATADLNKALVKLHATAGNLLKRLHLGV